jgi:hypothetical protein
LPEGESADAARHEGPHPAVTCTIPATTSVAHVRENMGAAYGLLPDEAMRRRMAAYVGRL